MRIALKSILAAGALAASGYGAHAAAQHDGSPASQARQDRIESVCDTFLHKEHKMLYQNWRRDAAYHPSQIAYAMGRCKEQMDKQWRAEGR